MERTPPDRPQFEPKSQRSRAVLAGSILWALSIIVVLWVVGHRNAVEVSLIVTLGSILVWTAFLTAGRIRRTRRERKGPASV